METKTEIRTDFLIKKRGFFSGFSSIFNLSGEISDFNTSKSGEEADLKAIASDWKMIGKDFANSIEKLTK
jgi:hypothetical protein